MVYDGTWMDCRDRATLKRPAAGSVDDWNNPSEDWATPAVETANVPVLYKAKQVNPKVFEEAVVQVAQYEVEVRPDLDVQRNDALFVTGGPTLVVLAVSDNPGGRRHNKLLACKVLA
jgi:hypothetical protein